jgi:hypothetical protein
MEKVAAALAPKDSMPWRKKMATFLKAAKALTHDDWLNQLRRSANALVDADGAIREELEAATGMGPWLIIDHIKGEITLFGQTLPFDSFKPRGLKLFLALASRPSEKVDDADLLKLAGLKTQVSSLASYISRDVREVLRPIVERHGPATGVSGPEVKSAMVLNERKEYQSRRVVSGYRLAILPQRVRHIHDPLLAHQQEQTTRDN